MALAYLLLAHKSPRQVTRLFRAIHHPDDVVILHFDRRADRALHQLGRELAARYSNVILLRPRAILWGGYQMAAVQIEAMATALRRHAHWHHFINLTGQDFPIKRRDEIEARLASNLEANYVSWFDPVFQPLWSNARERLARYYLEWPWLERALRVPGLGRRVRRLLGWQNRLPHLPRYQRPWPQFFRYYGGANHVALSRAGCQHLTSSLQAQRITAWLKHSAHANEIVFQSVLLNSPLASTVVNNHLREIDFPAHAPHPRTLTLADFDRLVASPQLFARKFDEKTDTAILDRLEQYLELPATGPGIRRVTTAPSIPPATDDNPSSAIDLTSTRFPSRS